jgi:hypothetical protein
MESQRNRMLKYNIVLKIASESIILGPGSDKAFKNRPVNNIGIIMISLIDNFLLNKLFNYSGHCYQN